MSFTYLLFVFFSTLCSYNLHWFLTREEIGQNSIRSNWNKENRFLLLGVFVFGVIGAAICFWFLQEHWMSIVPIAFFTFLYTAPKIPYRPFIWLRPFAVAKTLYLSLSWVYVTTVLPLTVIGMVFENSMYWFVLYRFLLLFSLCLLFDMRDQQSDKLTGIRNVTTLMTSKIVEYIFILSVGLLVLVGAGLSFWGFSMQAIFGLISPALILIVLYKRAKRHPTDWLYYGILDGLLCLSPLLSWLHLFI